MRVLVTGHEGFIGRNLCTDLEGHGIDVLGVDVASPRRPERVDIRDARGLARVFSRARPDAVVHLAALASVPGCESRPDYAMEVNEGGTRVVARLCARFGARMVFMSSAAVYGNPSRLPTPTDTPPRPVNVYGETKVLGERIVREESDGDAVIFRLFNAYGERCDRSYVIPDVIRKALSGLDPIPMQGCGTEARDFVYIRDVVSAIRHALVADSSGTYNLGTGLCTDIRTIAKNVVQALGLEGVGLQFEDVPRLGDFRVSWADLSDGNRFPGWTPRWSLADGIRNSVAYYASKPSRLPGTDHGLTAAEPMSVPRGPTPSITYAPAARARPSPAPMTARVRSQVRRPGDSP